MMVPVVSVIIPSRNRPESLGRCLDALAAQAMPVGSFEVIVVDDGSSPPLTIDASRTAATHECVLIRQRNTGPAGARQRGVAAATGEFLAFTDDDCLPDPLWLPWLVHALRERPDALVGGFTFNGLAGDVCAETSQLVLEMAYEHFNRDADNAYFFASNNMAVRRDRYLASGGFDADFDAPAAEDREFCDRWRTQGRPLLWERRAVVEHRHRQTLGGFLRLHWRYGQGAYRYHASRSRRASGTMREDLSFHAALPALMCRKIARCRPVRGSRIVLLLMVWQLANAAGFAHAWLSDAWATIHGPRGSIRQRPRS
ncbi:MAG: glycosyltransferase [Planctomycetia bacterium]